MRATTLILAAAAVCAVATPRVAKAQSGSAVTAVSKHALEVPIVIGATSTPAAQPAKAAEAAKPKAVPAKAKSAAPKPKPARAADAPAKAAPRPAEKAAAPAAAAPTPVAARPDSPVVTPPSAAAASAPAPAAPVATPAPPAAPPAPAAARPPVAAKPDSVLVKAAPEAKPAAPRAASAVTAGAGTVRFTGLVQAWYTATNNGGGNTFRVRRAQMQFAGELSPSAKWTVMLDPAKSLSVNNTYTTINGAKVVADESVNAASNLLQDAFVSVRALRFTFDAGQFRLPIGLEGGNLPAAGLETAEKPLFMSDKARGGALSDVRDVGAVVKGPLAPSVDFVAGAFNGTGESQNATDKNDQKALFGRLVLTSGVPGLVLGTTGVWSGRVTAANARKNRLAADARYAHGPFSARAEVMSARDGDTPRLGYYALGAYRLRALQLVARYDSFDPDTRSELAAGVVREGDWLAGLNYYVPGTPGKLQLDYVRRTFGSVSAARNQLLMNLQLSW